MYGIDLLFAHRKCCFFIKFTEDSLLINVLDAENMPSTLDEPNDDEKEGDLEDAPASHAHLDILSASNIQLKALTQSKYKGSNDFLCIREGRSYYDAWGELPPNFPHSYRFSMYRRGAFI